MTLAVVCFQWNVGYRDYRPAYVNLLARKVRENLRADHRFICISDEHGFDPKYVEAMPLPEAARDVAQLPSPEGNKFPSCYRRLWLFSEEARALGERILLLDIDCFVRDLDVLLDVDADFVAWAPSPGAWRAPAGFRHRIAGGTWLLRAGAHTEVWEGFNWAAAVRARREGWRGSDQAWISKCLSRSAAYWPRAAGIYQSRDFNRQWDRVPPAWRVLHFNGGDKPWKLTYVPWIAEYLGVKPTAPPPRGVTRLNRPPHPAIRRLPRRELVRRPADPPKDRPPKIVAVLATGESMSQAVADYVRGKCTVVAVNDAYRLAPWADALVCNDRLWWNVHKDALEFAGRKFCAMPVRGTELLRPDGRYPPGTNSGLQGIRVAELLGATRILLLGFDLRGSHFFGKHPAPLKNTTPARYQNFIRQFNRWRGPEVINCTPGSALQRFPMSDIATELGENVRAKHAVSN